MTRQAQFGVVAIGRNEGERLRACLQSALGLEVPVVYVDSNSTDGSQTLAAQLGADVVSLDLTTPFTAARARNAGLERLTASHSNLIYVQFVDGDCEIETGWLDAAVAFLDGHPNCAAVCGRRRERFPQASPYNRAADEEWNTPVGQADACGGDAMFRLGPLLEAKGYNPALVAGEEPELCLRLRKAGWSIWRIDQPMTIHDAAMHRFGQWWLRAVRSGSGYAQAWLVTRGFSTPLYRREILRALVWAVAVPAIGIAAALATAPVALLVVPAIWGLQLARLSIRHGWAKGKLLLLGKLAEAQGIVRFALRHALAREARNVFYK